MSRYCMRCSGDFQEDHFVKHTHKKTLKSGKVSEYVEYKCEEFIIFQPKINRY